MTNLDVIDKYHLTWYNHVYTVLDKLNQDIPCGRGVCPLYDRCDSDDAGCVEIIMKWLLEEYEGESE